MKGNKYESKRARLIRRGSRYIEKEFCSVEGLTRDFFIKILKLLDSRSANEELVDYCIGVLSEVIEKYNPLEERKKAMQNYLSQIGGVPIENLEDFFEGEFRNAYRFRGLSAVGINCRAHCFKEGFDRRAFYSGSKKPKKQRWENNL